MVGKGDADLLPLSCRPVWMFRTEEGSGVMRRSIIGIGLVVCVLFLSLLSLGAGNGTAPARKPPKSCLNAISEAETGFTIAGQGFQDAGQMLNKIGATNFNDPASINDTASFLTSKAQDISTLTSQLTTNANGFNQDKAKCRAGK